MSKFECVCGNRKPGNVSRCQACKKEFKAFAKGNVKRANKFFQANMPKDEAFDSEVQFTSRPIGDGFIEEIMVKIEGGRLVVVPPIYVPPVCEFVMGDDEAIPVGWEFDYINK